MSRMDEIRARLAAANLTGPMSVRVGYEGARHVPLIDHGTGLEAVVVARTFEDDKPWPWAELLAAAPSDLTFLVSEIEAVMDLVYDEDADPDPGASLLWLVERYVKVVQQARDQAYDTAGRAIEDLANERAENEHRREILRQIEAALANDRARMDPGADLLAVVCSLVEERDGFGRERGVATGTQVENDRLREALRQIAEHPCPNRECAGGSPPDYLSMGNLARLALGLPTPVAEERS